MRVLRDIDVAGKRVVVRADLDIRFDGTEKSSPTKGVELARLKEVVPTVRSIVARGGSCVLLGHLGDPTPGKPDPQSSLKGVAMRLGDLLGCDVPLIPDVGAEGRKLIASLPAGGVTVLENLRFHPGEKRNDPAFAAELAKWGESYIFDAFAAAHLPHASVISLPKRFEERAVGLLVEKEIGFARAGVESPKRPLCVALGGTKLSLKLATLMHLASKADKVLLGGAMANTFLAAQGIQMGRSLYEPDCFGKALELFGILGRRDCKVYLPVDLMVGPSPGAAGLARPVPALEVPPDMMALDIGPATSLLYRQVLQNAETIVWQGAMGSIETEEYAKGTSDLIESLAIAHGTTISGGGETDHLIHSLELAHKFDHISTGSAPFSLLLEGRELPALRALE
jgi:phosphoglycerate kinase